LKPYLLCTLSVLLAAGCSVPPPTTVNLPTGIPATVAADLTPTNPPSAVAGVGEIIATTTLELEPAGIAVGPGALWLWSEETGRVMRLDTATNQVVATIKIGNPNLAPYGSPKDVVVDGETVWVADASGSAVVRIDTQTNKIAERISLDNVKLADGSHIFAPFGLALNGNTLWVSDFDLNTVIRIDTTSKKVVAVIEGVLHPEGLAVSDGAVWAVQHRSQSLVRIDPATNAIVETVHLVGGTSSGGTCGMCLDWAVASEDSIWVPMDRGWAIARIDPQTNKSVTPVTFNSNVRDVAIGENAIWVVGSLAPDAECAKYPSFLARIDPRSNALVGQLTIPCAFSVAVSDGDVWVGSTVTNTMTRIRPDK